MIKEIFSRIKRALTSLLEKDGFSLLEIMIVIVIMSILVITVAPRFMDMPQKARVAKTKEMIASLELALDRYSLDNGSYPTTEQGLQALIEEPTTEPAPNNYNPGGYLKGSKIPKDPWGNDYSYTSPGEDNREYDIVSLGADGQEGGEGINADITNWSE